MSYWRSLTAIALLAVPSVAFGNAGQLPDTIDLTMLDGNAAIGLEATFGYLTSPDGVDFHWVCHETIVPPESSATPRFFQNTNGVMLATLGGTGIAYEQDYTVFRSVDGGCNWASASTDLQNVVMWNIAFDPANQDHAIGGSSNLGAGVNNAIWSTPDAGVTWAKSNLDLMDRLFLSVTFSPNNSQIAWATAAWFTPAAQGYVYRSTNGGVDWTETLFDFAPGVDQEAIIYYMAASPTDDLTAYVRVDGLVTDYLRRTVDGGANFTTVLQVDDNIEDVTIDAGGAVWAVTQLTGVYRATDGVNFGLVNGSPLVRGIDSNALGVWTAVSQLSDGFALALTDDGGATFDPRFVFKDLKGPKPCGVGTDVADICVPLWPGLAQQLGITIPIPDNHFPDDPYGLNRLGGGEDPGCSCGVSGPRVPSSAPGPRGALLLGALGFLIWWRRRGG